MSSREFTTGEVRIDFVRTVKAIARYWAKLPGKTDEAKCLGAAHSILVLLDGENGNMPGFIIAPQPHKDDKEWCLQDDENYFPENNNPVVNCNIAGALHELFYKV